MQLLKTFKYPLLMSALIFGVSLLNFQRTDPTAAILAVSYLLLGSISSAGKSYLDLTGKSKTAKATFSMIVDPPGVFVLILGLFYMMTGDLHWIFLGVAGFLAFIVLGISFGDRMHATGYIQSFEKDDKKPSE